MGSHGLKLCKAKRLLILSVKMRYDASSHTSIKDNALPSSSSAENIEALPDSENEPLSRPATNAQPTPSDVLGPSVDTATVRGNMLPGPRLSLRWEKIVFLDFGQREVDFRTTPHPGWGGGDMHPLNAS